MMLERNLNQAGSHEGGVSDGLLLRDQSHELTSGENQSKHTVWCVLHGDERPG